MVSILCVPVVVKALLPSFTVQMTFRLQYCLLASIGSAHARPLAPRAEVTAYFEPANPYFPLALIIVIALGCIATLSLASVIKALFRSLRCGSGTQSSGRGRRMARIPSMEEQQPALQRRRAIIAPESLTVLPQAKTTAPERAHVKRSLQRGDRRTASNPILLPPPRRESKGDY